MHNTLYIIETDIQAHKHLLREMTVHRRGSVSSFKLLRRSSTNSCVSSTPAIHGDDSDQSISTDTSNFHKKTSKVAKRVRFDKIFVREYPLILGNNFCSVGPSLQLGWVPISEYEIDLEKYEEAKPPARSKTELVIPPQIKVTILQSNGYTLREIACAIQQQETNATEQNRKNKRGRIRKKLESFVTLQSRSFATLTQMKYTARSPSQRRHEAP